MKIKVLETDPKKTTCPFCDDRFKLAEGEEANLCPDHKLEDVV